MQQIPRKTSENVGRYLPSTCILRLCHCDLAQDSIESRERCSIRSHRSALKETGAVGQSALIDTKGCENAAEEKERERERRSCVSQHLISSGLWVENAEKNSPCHSNQNYSVGSPLSPRSVTFGNARGTLFGQNPLLTALGYVGSGTMRPGGTSSQVKQSKKNGRQCFLVTRSKGRQWN